MARCLQPGARRGGGRCSGALHRPLARSDRRACRGHAADVELQVVRTVPEKIYDFLPQGDFRILETYTRALRSARKLVYFESQFLWSAQVVEILANKLREPPSDDFRVVVLLPAKPNNGADTTRG